MVCSIGYPYSELQDYAEENFTTKSQTISNSRWFGSGAERLGLSGQITSQDYAHVYNGQDNQGNALRRKLTHKNSRPGRDLTFSAPKSVSILALVLKNEQIIVAHDRSVDRALKYVEQNCIYTRLGAGGREERKTDNMIAAIFQHDSSRNLDPNLHSHCVIFNLTQGEDEKWRAMNNPQLYQQKMTIGMIYHHELSQELTKLGYSINWSKDGTFDIAGFNSEQLKQFSTRRTEIINLAGIESTGKEKQIACLTTRKNKKYINSEQKKTLHINWYQKSNELKITSPQLTKQTTVVDKYPRDHAEQKQIRQELISNSVDIVTTRDNKTKFTEHELLKEILIQAKGKHQLNELQHDIKQHPSIFPNLDGTLTTIELYKQEKTENKITQLQNSISKSNFHIREISNHHDLIFQASQSYQNKQSKTIVLTDTKKEQDKITADIRQELIQQGKLGNDNIQIIKLSLKNVELTNPTHYEVGNVVKFNRESKKFSNQRFYKVLSVDHKNQELTLGDRFDNRIILPMDRYQNRQVFKVEKLELRTNEKMRFERGQYINGRQVAAKQSFIITEIKDKQAISIKIKGKENIIKASDLFFTEYDYADTVKLCQNKQIDHCIYCSTEAKSSEIFQHDINELASRTKAQLSIYTSDNCLNHNLIVKTQHLQPNMALQQAPKESSTKVLQALDDTLFELASSANYLVTNENLWDDTRNNIQDFSNHDTQELNNLNPKDSDKYYAPGGITIEKDTQNISVSYDGKSIEFDQDFNVIKNDLSVKDINYLNQKLEKTKQVNIEHNRSRQIHRDHGLSL